ncbi:hypothetical protein RRG08_027120 [Elysia crispata]|uniref:MADF domain-containing protein n=1 Tax=Elysia crispata TaxID=231223 RepID=A0AAE0YVA9_9GAST|nr:hypothetical protein RRG08_027120 [Elysia crispata]
MNVSPNVRACCLPSKRNKARANSTTAGYRQPQHRLPGHSTFIAAEEPKLVKMSRQLPLEIAEALVLAVKKRELLYNSSCPEYKNRNMTELAWAAISEEVGPDPFYCRSQWAQLRATFNRIVAQQKLPNGPMCGKKPKWYLYRQMSFLKNHLANGSLPSDINYRQDQSESNHENSSLDETCDVSQVPSEGSTEIAWSPIFVVENLDQDESDTEMKVLETSGREPSNIPEATSGHLSSLETKSDIPLKDASSSLEKGKRKRPISPKDPVQDAFLALIQERRKKSAALVPAVESELQLFRSLAPFIRQLSEKNKRKFISKTTSLLMDLLNAQDLDQ